MQAYLCKHIVKHLKVFHTSLGGTICVRVFYDDAKIRPMMCIRINDAHDGFMRPKNEKHHMYICFLWANSHMYILGRN